jgi:hypothetical protein
VHRRREKLNEIGLPSDTVSSLESCRNDCCALGLVHDVMLSALLCKVQPELALVMSNLQPCHAYADIMLRRDPKNKFAYHTKGVVLSKRHRDLEAICGWHH